MADVQEPVAVLAQYGEDGVALLTLNRPQARNAINRDMRARLAQLFDEMERNEAVRAVVLTGNDSVFAAGADLKDFEQVGTADILLRNNHLLWRQIAAFPKPVIAAVRGKAWGGGCELAMHADIIVAGQSATFAQPEIKLGLMPGAGGIQRLARAAGKHQAMQLLLTGRVFEAEEALRIGLASSVVADTEVLTSTLELARVIAAMPPVAARQIKEVLLAGLDASLEAGLLLERKAFQILFDTSDFREGMAAFREKRTPVFRGR